MPELSKFKRWSMPKRPSACAVSEEKAKTKEDSKNRFTLSFNLQLGSMKN